MFAVILIGSMPQAALAQDEDSDAQEAEQQTGDDGETPAVEDQIIVTGSRILSSPLTERAPLVEVTEVDLLRSGLTNLGDTLQQLPSMGTAINSNFNVPGNSGFPQDGNGIGAGAVQVSLRAWEPNAPWCSSMGSVGSRVHRPRAFLSPSI